MKLYISGILLFLLNAPSSPREMRFGALGFISSKNDIVKAFGPATVTKTDYECGMFSTEQPGAPYYELSYRDFDFLGNDKEKYVLSKIRFDAAGSLKLYVGKQVLSGLTTESEFTRLLNIGDEHVRGEEILIRFRDADDGIVFAFRNGKLLQMEHWSPC